MRRAHTLWQELVSGDDDAILAWAGEQAWSEPMRRCAQDAVWHPEGDVWTHTEMVFEEVRKLDGYDTLSHKEQVALLFTALLHDSGKPKTTRPDPETGRLRSPKHSLAGAHLAREVLREAGCPLAEREEIVALVRYHGRPPYLLESARPEHEVIRLSTILTNRQLHRFAVADTRGRDRNEDSRPEEALHLWRDLADELGCLDGPYRFANDQARFLFHRETLTSLHYVPHESFSCTVTMMSGLPGAGKDTWLSRHRPGLPVISLDGLREELEIDPEENQGRVAQAAKARCRERLAAGTSFAFNATNLTVSMRARWIDLFAAYGARIEIVYLEPALDVLAKQNREREAAVPESVITRLLSKLEIPTLAEAHAVTWVG
jgi:predicted kinase